MADKLEQFKDIHKGHRAFLIAGGPSLSHTDLSMLKNELVFSLKEDDPLNFEKISAIFRSGHSRFPVCSKDDPHVIVGILLTKVCSFMHVLQGRGRR